MTATLDQLVAVGIKMRDKKEEINKEAKKLCREIEHKYKKVTEAIDVILKATGQESARTVSGTCFYKPEEHVSVEDWDKFRQDLYYEAYLEWASKSNVHLSPSEINELIVCMKDHGPTNYLTKKLAKEPIKTFMETISESGRPPLGVKYEALKSITLRKP